MAARSGASTPRDRAVCQGKKIDKLVSFVKDYGAKGLAYIAIQEDGTVKSSFAKFMKEEEMSALIEAMGGEPGDLLLFAADKNKVVWDVPGRPPAGAGPSDWSFWIRTSTSSCGSPSSRCWSGARSRTGLRPCIILSPCPWRRIWRISTAIRDGCGPRPTTSCSTAMRSAAAASGSIRPGDPGARCSRYWASPEEQAQDQFGFLLDCLQIRSAASRRTGLRTGPSGDADGERRQHPGRDRIPQGERRLRPYDRGSGQSNEGAA